MILNDGLVTDSEMNLFFQFSNKFSESGFIYTNSIYIPNFKKLNVLRVNFLGSTGDFKDQIYQLNDGNYTSFYADNSNFAGLTASVTAKMVDM